MNEILKTINRMLETLKNLSLWNILVFVLVIFIGNHFFWPCFVVYLKKNSWSYKGFTDLKNIKRSADNLKTNLIEIKLMIKKIEECEKTFGKIINEQEKNDHKILKFSKFSRSLSLFNY